MIEFHKIDITKRERWKDHNTRTFHQMKKWKGQPRPYRAYKHQGMLSSAEQHLLFNVARTLGNGNYANLGCFKGLSTACLAYGLKEARVDGTVYTVDVFSKLKRNRRYDKRLPQIFEGHGIAQYLRVCKGYTSDWAKELEGTPFNFVFIDACHKYSAALDDYLRWSPMIVEGGLLAFHDVNVCDVNKVIEEVVKKDWEEIEQVYITKVFKRHGIYNTVTPILQSS